MYPGESRSRIPLLSSSLSRVSPRAHGEAGERRCIERVIIDVATFIIINGGATKLSSRNLSRIRHIDASSISGFRCECSESISGNLGLLLLSRDRCQLLITMRAPAKLFSRLSARCVRTNWRISSPSFSCRSFSRSTFEKESNTSRNFAKRRCLI